MCLLIRAACWIPAGRKRLGVMRALPTARRKPGISGKESLEAWRA